MEKRTIARIIAYIDSALAALQLVGVVLLLVIVISENVDVSGVSTGALWAVLAVLFIIVLIEAFAAFSLIRATPVEFDGWQRLRWIRFWRGITIFLVIMQILGLAGLLFGGGGINAGAVAVPAVLVIYRGLAIYLVQRYINEIQSTVV